MFSLCILNNYIFAGTFLNGPNGVWRRPLNELVGIQPVSNEIPNGFSLSQNYPNPFNPATKIKFNLPNPSKGGAQEVKLVIFDVLGREVSTLVKEQLKAGTYTVDWDASNHPSGVYFYILKAGDYTETKKMVLVK